MSSAGNTYYAKRASTLADPATAAVFKQADNSALAAFVALPRAAQSNTSVVDGVPFYVRASGLVTIGSAGTSTFLPGLYYSAAARTQITIVAGNLVAGVASTALTASGTFPWVVEFTGIWESTVGAMGGYYDQYVAIASGTTTQAVTINLLASINLATDGAGFVCGCTMGTSRTGTVVTLKSFALEVL
jgi:hypothetical protein